MEGPLEGADGGGDGGVHVRKGGDGDARGKGAGIHAMIRVEDEGDIQRLDGLGLGLLAIKEVEEVGGLAEILADGREGFALPGAVEVGGDDADLCGDVEGADAVLSTLMSSSSSVS